ncbi:MAG TPA: hypothetical protein VF057_08040, partial [Thermoanaerobaculia bacterium]
MVLSLLLAITIGTPDLRLEHTRESLTGTHHRYRQYIDGLPVIGGEVNVTVRRDGHREESRALAESVPPATSKGADVWVNENGVARPARRVIEDGVIRYLATDGETVIRCDVLEFPAKPARVFDPNPVVKLNAPSLRDEADAASAVPPAAYS